MLFVMFDNGRFYYKISIVFLLLDIYHGCVSTHTYNTVLAAYSMCALRFYVSMTSQGQGSVVSIARNSLLLLLAPLVHFLVHVFSKLVLFSLSQHICRHCCKDKVRVCSNFSCSVLLHIQQISLSQSRSFSISP